MAAPSARNLLFTSDDGMTVNLVIPVSRTLVYNAFTRLHFSGRVERKEGERNCWLRLDNLPLTRKNTLCAVTMEPKFSKQDITVWTEFIWLRIGTSGELL
jgi:hypothetical protein